ncbi:MAG: phosphoribosyltransferase [Burkholderiaceae bacterium]|nr:phosphoribosyltransferase [Burkholderiaceae bacterium]
MHTKPFRGPWANSFPNVWIHADESTVKKHSSYAQAKAGDIGAAVSLVAETINVEVVRQLEAFGTGKNPVLISVHAEEAIGVNAIPEVLADFLAYATNWELEELVVQANVVNHTGAGGFARLSRQAIFEGEIEHGRNYIIVDDFIGQGGTIANLRGHILQQHGIVIGATVLTGKPYSAILALSTDRLNELRAKHGQIENWWQRRFGFGFDSLSASEARYLINTEDTDTIRTRIENADDQA